MEFFRDNILTILIFLPVVGSLLMIIWANNDDSQKRFALGFAILNFILSLGLLRGYDSATTEAQFVKDIPWITAFNLGIHYHVGIDGLSVWLVILTTLLFPIAILGSWHSVHKRMREFLMFMLLLEAGVIGVFVSLDFFLFYVFWE